MKISVVSANLGEFDKPVSHVAQTDADIYTFTDGNFPPRFNAMTPRLQARIVKMFMWQFIPGYEYYLWCDASCRLSSHDSAQWFLDYLGDADIAVFKHPNRKTVQQEADFLRERLELERSGKKQPYVLPRYENEDLDGQMDALSQNWPLFASTAFIYRDSPQVQEAMKEWWYHTSRFHTIDQLGFPEAIKNLKVAVIPDKYTDCYALEYTR